MSTNKYGPMTAAEHFQAARRLVRAAREFRGYESYYSFLDSAARHRIEAKHIRWRDRPLERY